MEGESFKDYIYRVFHSKAWTTNKDISKYDLRPDGAAEFNDYVITAPHVYCKCASPACLVLRPNMI